MASKQIASLIKKDNGTRLIVFGNPRDKEGNLLTKTPVEFPLVINEGDMLFANTLVEDVQYRIDKGYIEEADAADALSRAENSKVKLKIKKVID